MGGVTGSGWSQPRALPSAAGRGADPAPPPAPRGILHLPKMRGQPVTFPHSLRLDNVVLAAERPPLHVATTHGGMASTEAQGACPPAASLARRYPAGLRGPDASLCLEEKLSLRLGGPTGINLHFFPSIDENSKQGIFIEDSARFQYQILAACVKKSCIAQGRGKET